MRQMEYIYIYISIGVQNDLSVPRPVERTMTRHACQRCTQVLSVKIYLQKTPEYMYEKCPQTPTKTTMNTS